MAGDSFGLGVFAQLSGGPGGADAMARRLDRMVQRGSVGNRAAGYAVMGHRAMFLVSRGIRTNIGGWPAPSSFPRAFRGGGQPLMDTRRLSSSIAYMATPAGMATGTNVKYARALNRGALIRPKGKFLLLPLNPPLTPSEVRAWPRGKAGIQARYPGSVFLLHGPDGPGIYRKAGFVSGHVLATHTIRRGKDEITVRRRSAVRSVRMERIAAAVRQVRVKPHGFLKWRPEWVRDIAQRYAQWYFDPKLANPFPATGGNPDTGARGGGA